MYVISAKSFNSKYKSMTFKKTFLVYTAWIFIIQTKARPMLLVIKLFFRVFLINVYIYVCDSLTGKTLWKQERTFRSGIYKILIPAYSQLVATLKGRNLTLSVT